MTQTQIAAQRARPSDTARMLTAAHSPNVWAFQILRPGISEWTIFKSHPGDTRPRLQVRNADDKGLLGAAIDCGAIDYPERFGPTGDLAEFKAYAVRFFDNTPVF